MGNARAKSSITKRSFLRGGYGILREEVWMDEEDKVARYNLAFVVPHLTRVDHGRVLGYDNRHGYHERHFMGKKQAVD